MRIKSTLLCAFYAAGIAGGLCARAQTITSTLGAGTNVVGGSATALAQVFVCVVSARPAGATPACAAGNAAALTNPAAPGTQYVTAAGGTYNAILAAVLTAGQYVYVTQVVAGGSTSSPVFAVAAAPVLSGTPAATVAIGSGKGQPVNAADFSSVQVFFCATSAQPVGQPDCSTQPVANQLTPVNPSAPGGKSVSTGPDGSFTETFTNAAPATSTGAPPVGWYIWATQVATPAGAGAVAQVKSTTPVVVIAKPALPALPQFGAKAVALTNSVTVIAAANGDNLSIWEFDPGSGVTGSCDPTWMPKGSPLQIVTTAGTGAAPGAPTTTTSTSAPVASTAPTVLTVNQPLQAGQTLCLVETATAAGSSPAWAPQSLVVADPNDFGRFQTYFTLGAQATNQQSSTGSSTVGQYLEVGFNAAYAFANGIIPGFATNVDIRLSPIPVAAPASTSTSNSVGTLTPSSFTPNQLSSQQSVRGVASFYAPWKVKGWNNNTDYFTFAPLAQGGFGTLLNPSTSSTSGSSSASSPAQITTTTFAPGFYFWGVGARFGVDRFAANPDKAPQMITQVQATLGDFSNLPSYVCKPVTNQPSNPYATGTATVVTACGSSQYPVTGTSTTTNGVTTVGAPWSYYTYFRTVRPRLNIEAIVKLPGYPFILGVDANIQQYGVFNKPNLDYLNKPGNDVRVYLGITVDIATLISKL